MDVAERRRNDGAGDSAIHANSGAGGRLLAAGHQSKPSTRSWRQVQWLHSAAGRLRRRGRVLRVAAAILAAVGLLSLAVIGGGAQEARAEIGIRDLSEYPTHTTVDSFIVELSNLTSTEEYQVIVSSDGAGLGVGACGASTQTATVTDAESEDLTFLVFACAPGRGDGDGGGAPGGRDKPRGVGQPAADGGGAARDRDHGVGGADSDHADDAGGRGGAGGHPGGRA